ncbi:unnamed protein product [Lampetra fluviatilis]
MLGDEALLLTGMFLALNSIDFSFCLKGEDLANENNAVIDYTPYLKYTQSYGTISSDGDDMRTLGSSSEDATPDAPPAEILANENSWYSRYKRLEQQYRLACEQKCYLEELVRVREAQLAEATDQHTAGVQRQHEITLGWRVKRQGMEATILALQAELRTSRNTVSCSQCSAVESLVDVRTAGRASTDTGHALRFDFCIVAQLCTEGAAAHSQANRVALNS